jgi:FecR protein
MQRRQFITLLGSVVASLSARRMADAQELASSSATGDGQIGQVATLQGSATVTRTNAAGPLGLNVNDFIFKNDTLQTGANSTLGVTFDDETTFNLNANTRIVVDEFVYQEGGNGNAALFTVARGTAAFVASKVAATSDMKIATPVATMGIRGTTGLDVPETGGTSEPKIKLYPDADGHVGRIEVFDRQGAPLGTLTQGASAFALRPGAGGGFQAVPFHIPAFEAARDRVVLQGLFVSHNIGRQQTLQRRQLRGPNQQRRNNPRQRNERRPGGPHERNFQRPPGHQQQENRLPRGPGSSRPQSRGPNPSGRKQNR